MIAKANGSKCTDDFLFDGRIQIRQHRKGYRFSSDAILLVWFAASNKRRSPLAADLGCGCGVVGLGLLAASGVELVVGIDRQASLLDLAHENSALNNFETSFFPIRADIRGGCPAARAHRFDTVVANPPYWPVWNDRMPRSPERQTACHETHGSIDDWCSAASRLLSPRRGRGFFVYPARRLDALLLGFSRARLSATKIVCVHATPQTPAETVLVEVRPGKPSRVEILSPLLLADSNGRQTDRFKQILDGSFSQTISALEDKRCRP
jgi:tRNA1Val (adenine37-N6)-methyltransferase